VNFSSLPGLAVLNPNGRDPDQSFAEGPGLPSGGLHPPVNYHAYAACTQGGFYRHTEFAARHRSVLLLLRGEFFEAGKAFETLKAHGCFIAVSFKESGTHQVAKQLARPKRFRLFREIAAAADLCLSSTPDLVPLYASVSKRVAFVPTPYPVDVLGWDFSKPAEDRKGIFIGTREFDVPTRNHLLALATARTLSFPVTVVNPDGRSGLRKLAMLKFPEDQLTIVEPLPFPEYLRLIASHRLVLQFDQSAVPGQVAGDSLLCGIPTVGGNGAIDRLAFPELNGHGRSFEELRNLARRLLEDDAFYSQQVAEQRKIDQVSFAKTRETLASLFPGLG
jgi:hypothetical protein